jgi:pSer/pThr/pTyr-binding forkhead associated (FHA) protein
MPSICPNCNAPTNSEDQRFCYRCGFDLRPGESGNLNAEPAPPSRDAVTPVEPTGSSTPGTNSNTPVSTSIARDENHNTLGVTPFEITLSSVKPDADNQQKATLKILLPSGDLFDREITKVETQIGKGPRNDIVIADPAVSTSHALLRAEGNTYSVRDVGSRNGTYVNGERLTEIRQINHGDVIGIGLTKLTLRVSGQADTGIIQTTEALPSPVAHQGPLPATEESLAQVIVSESIATQANIDKIRSGRRLHRALLDEGLISDENLRNLMSRVFRIPIVNLRSERIDEDTAISFPSRLARDSSIFAYRKDDTKLFIAVADPTDINAIDQAKFETRLEIDVKLATSSEIAEQIEKFYGPKLIGVLPSGEKIRFLVNSHEIGIGKAPHNDLVVADPTVSNTHAVLLFRDDCYSIIDLGSRNGTYVNGEKVTNHARTLRHGDSIQMGQTVLTFRNSGETAENVTATLSMESLEEVRRRASLEHGLNKPAPPVQDARTPAVPMAMPQFVAPPAQVVAQDAVAPADVAVKEVKEHKEHKEHKEPKNTDQADDHDEEKGDKKKKKKDKSEERIRAAYVGAVSRIIAQITGAILTAALTVIVAYYFSRSMNSPSPPPSLKGELKSRFTNPGSITAIKGGKFEASGVAHVPDTNGVLFVDDGKSDRVFWMEFDDAGNQVGETTPVPLGVNIANPEGIVYGGGFFYVVGSQGDPAAGSGNVLARFAFDGASKTIKGQPELINDLRGFLLSRVGELKGEGEKPGIQGGLNIEGIAWDPDPGRERLLLGLRSPLMNNQAIIIPIRMADVRSFNVDSIHLSDPPTIPVSLGGYGIRAIQYDSQIKAFLIISGAPDPLPKTEFKLWEWSGKRNTDPTEIASLDPKMKPEGVTSVRIGGKDYALVFGDDGSYVKFDYSGQ